MLLSCVCALRTLKPLLACHADKNKRKSNPLFSLFPHPFCIVEFWCNMIKSALGNFLSLSSGDDCGLFFLAFYNQHPPPSFSPCICNAGKCVINKHYVACLFPFISENHRVTITWRAVHLHPHEACGFSSFKGFSHNCRKRMRNRIWNYRPIDQM